jgi:TatA/E family protein of Tat protein translocase
MGNLGWPEILIILVIALIVFGPRKLPELGKTLGQSLAQFRKASEDFKRTWEEEVEVEKRRLDAPSSSTVHEADYQVHEPISDASPPETETAKEEQSNYWNDDFNVHGSEATAEAQAEVETVQAVPAITHESQAVPRQSKRDWM